jgi:hypothetical protein
MEKIVKMCQFYLTVPVFFLQTIVEQQLLENSTILL